MLLERAWGPKDLAFSRWRGAQDFPVGMIAYWAPHKPTAIGEGAPFFLNNTFLPRATSCQVRAVDGQFCIEKERM